MKIYDEFPTSESDDFLLRPVEKEDSTDLLAVYSDKNALPFFNSDNCDGDIFYYPTIERMNDAILFWQSARLKHATASPTILLTVLQSCGLT